MKNQIALLVTLAALSPLVVAAQNPDKVPDAPAPPVSPTPAAKPDTAWNPRFRFAQNDDENAIDKAMADAREQLADAEEAARTAAATFGADFGAARSRNLIVNTSKTNSEDLNSLDEDISIMARVLDKALNTAYRPGREPMLGIFVKGGPLMRGDQNMYIEGQGVILVRNVKMPLVQSTDATDDQSAQPKDSAWQEAKSEINGSGSRDFRKERADRESSRFNGPRIDTLKREMIGAMKNAANIAGLGQDETITVVLVGPPASRVASKDEDGKRTKATRPSTLTIRLKKSDAADGLSGSIDQAELVKRANVSAY